MQDTVFGYHFKRPRKPQESTRNSRGLSTYPTQLNSSQLVPRGRCDNHGHVVNVILIRNPLLLLRLQGPRPDPRSRPPSFAPRRNESSQRRPLCRHTHTQQKKEKPTKTRWGRGRKRAPAVSMGTRDRRAGLNKKKEILGVPRHMIRRERERKRGGGDLNRVSESSQGWGHEQLFCFGTMVLGFKV